MKLTEMLAAGKFLITGEVSPPKGVDLSETTDSAEKLRGLVDAINVTDIQSSIMRAGSMAVCHILRDRGFEVVFQLTCRDRNRLALQSHLLSAYVLGIENVLCLTGDHTTIGDHTRSKPVFDLDSASLLAVAKGLCEGHDIAGEELLGKPDFCLGAAVNPNANPLEPQLAKMRKKLSAGAEFFQTQAVYDIDAFKRFRDAIHDIDAPILLGVLILKSARMARFINEKVAGVSIPESVIEQLARAGGSKSARENAFVELIADIIDKLRGYIDGIHLMPLGWHHIVSDILDAAGLREE
jgi:5,10-methylenetetrahydrofolate reductase